MWSVFKSRMTTIKGGDCSDRNLPTRNRKFAYEREIDRGMQICELKEIYRRVRAEPRSLPVLAHVSLGVIVD